MCEAKGLGENSIGDGRQNPYRVYANRSTKYKLFFCLYVYSSYTRKYTELFIYKCKDIYIMIVRAPVLPHRSRNY